MGLYLHSRNHSASQETFYNYCNVPLYLDACDCGNTETLELSIVLAPLFELLVIFKNFI